MGQVILSNVSSNDYVNVSNKYLFIIVVYNRRISKDEIVQPRFDAIAIITYVVFPFTCISGLHRIIHLIVRLGIDII